jgi:hypothetical protein
VNRRPHLALASLVLGVAACGRNDAADAAGPAPAAKSAPPAPLAAPKPPADPMKDLAAWNALSETDRHAKATAYAASVDAGNMAAVGAARDLLKERGEDAAVVALAKAAIGKGATASWAHEAAGEISVGPEVDACLKASEAAAEFQDAKFVELRRMRDGNSGSWWANDAWAKKVRALCAEVKAADAFLQTRYGEGVAQWASWQRAIPVMQDAPAIHGARGPYVVFVQLDSKVGPAAKPDEPAKPVQRREMKDATADEIARANAVLEKNLALMEDFYEGWSALMGPIFGFTRYGPENVDRVTLLKLDVFLNESEYHRFNQKMPGYAFMDQFARAFYSHQEPRFITTFDGGADEDPLLTEHVQCHEAVHQLVHLYTWDLTRKELGREPTWEDAGAARPLWSNEGFAEFFSSFTRKDGKRAWMQPYVYRLQHLYVLADVAAAKKWRPLDIKEFLRLRHAGELTEAAAHRVGPGAKAIDRLQAENLIGNLFYAKAWSFVFFLWNAEEGGKPKYRDRAIEYFRREFHLQYEMNRTTNAPEAKRVSMNDFLKAMGLRKSDADKDDAKLAAFEKEWLEFEAKLVAQHKTPDWEAARLAARKAYQVK